MTALQKLQLRASEIKTRLADLASVDGTLSDEQRSELDALVSESKDVEKRSQALLVAGDGPEGTETRTDDDAEGRELRQLMRRVDVGEIVDCTIAQRGTTGAEAELQTHFRLDANQVPADLLIGDLETRDVTPGATNTGRTQDSIIQPVFAKSCLSYLGIPTPRVGVGERTFPLLSTRPTIGGPHDDSTSVDETTGAFTTKELSPERLQASFEYRWRDGLRFAGMDNALRQALSSGLMEALDKEALAGDNGLLNGTNLADHTVNAVDTFTVLVSNLGYNRVDGRFASDTDELKLLMGTGTYAFAATLYNEPDAVNALNHLREYVGGIKVSAFVPAVASDKQNVLIRRGMRRDAILPIWQNVDLIVDRVTKAKTGEIVLTAMLAMNFAVIRPDGFYKQQTQHA